MVISRTPLRISIVGGGTDLPVWYKEHGSMFVSAAIDKYIYTTVHRSQFNKNIRVRYSKMEEVATVDEIQNDIVRETLKTLEVTDSIEITSHADIPSGTGLGSSGAFGVGLLHALCPKCSRAELAGCASFIQVDRLKYPIGPQDQFATAYGGINVYEVHKNGKLDYRRLYINLEDKLCLFYTGIRRDANKVLKASSTEWLDKIQELAWEFVKDPSKYGEILKEHWEFKKKRGGMTTPEIDELYTTALKNGAIGGKLIGAGGGGFLMFYTDDREKLIASMPLQHMPFKFDYDGSTIIYNDGYLS